MTDQTILLRQAHPRFISEGTLTSQVFMPFPKDREKLSVYDADQIRAVEAYRHYTETLNHESEGVWGVSCIEVSTAGLSSLPDPLPESPAHALIDFVGKTPNVCRKLAKRLKEFALARGRLHP